jgi:hypothetical protein
MSRSLRSLVVAALLLLGGVATLATPAAIRRQPPVSPPAAVSPAAVATPTLQPTAVAGSALTTPTPQATATAGGTVSRPTATPIVPTPTATMIPLPDVGLAQQARFAPDALVIPRIGVDARIVSVGVTPDGQLEAPVDYSTVGWYAAGTLPGAPGRAVLDGHLDSRTGPAVFYRLGELAVGDEIIVRMGAGRDDLRFVVTESALFWTDEAPLDRIYGASEQPELVLITCDGPFDGGGGGYLQRRVIFATLAESAPS